MKYAAESASEKKSFILRDSSRNYTALWQACEHASKRRSYKSKSRQNNSVNDCHKYFFKFPQSQIPRRLIFRKFLLSLRLSANFPRVIQVTRQSGNTHTAVESVETLTVVGHFVVSSNAGTLLSGHVANHRRRNKRRSSGSRHCGHRIRERSGRSQAGADDDVASHATQQAPMKS